MSVNFATHRKAILDAYNAVIDDKKDTDWALFTYDGNSNDLKLHDTGDDGLEELESEFNSGKMMYAFVRVVDPNTKLKKFLLIVWQGESVPSSRKGASANHIRDIERFFKGSNLTIYARCDDDADPEEIMRQVTKATANFTYVTPKDEEAEDLPKAVGSVYKRINPQHELKTLKKESFWEKVEREEKERQEAEKARDMELRKKESERLKKEQANTERRLSEVIKSREEEISVRMKAQKLADDQSKVRDQEKKQWVRIVTRFYISSFDDTCFII